MGAGQLADLAFTVKYAAPETVRAYQAGHHAAIVDPAVDVWAFGVRTSTLLCVCAIVVNRCHMV